MASPTKQTRHYSRMVALATATLIILPAVASADVITLSQGQVINSITVNTDDTYIRSGDGGTDTNFGTQTILAVEDFGANPRLDTTLIAFKDLFAILPQTVGGETLNITNATLNLTTLGSASFGITAARVTTNWLPLAAGANQSVVTFDTASGSTSWVDGSFSSADYDTVENVGAPDTGFGDVTSFDVTDMVNAMYGDGINDGIALMNQIGQSGFYEPASSEYNGGSAPPALEITFDYVPAVGVPEPATVAIFTLAAGGLLLRRRRSV